MTGGCATQVIQVKEIMMTNSNNSSKALDKGHKYDQASGGNRSSDSEPRNKGRQYASRMWWRNVKLVLILDLVVCCILFAIWLGICRGFSCVQSWVSCYTFFLGWAFLLQLITLFEIINILDSREKKAYDDLLLRRSSRQHCLDSTQAPGMASFSMCWQLRFIVPLGRLLFWIS